MIQELKSLMKSQRISQNKVAAELGLSAAALSQYLAGKYAGDSKNIETLAAAWIAARKGEDRCMLLPQGIVKTHTVSLISEAALTVYNDEKGGIALVYGAPGTGKTTAIQAFHHQYGFSVVITANALSTARTVLCDIADHIGESTNGTLHAVYTRIKRKLTGVKKVILIDEADHLGDKTLNILRSLHDETGIGIVLVGIEQLRHNITGTNGEKEYLRSRISLAYKTTDIYLADARKILGDIGEKNTKEILDLSQGKMRRMSNLLKRATNVAKLNNSDLTPEIIKAANTLLLT